MPKITEELKKEVNEKLKFIGIHLEKIPEEIKKPDLLEFKPLKTYTDKEHRVYKHIPVSQIQILVTPKNRGASIKEKYDSATYLYSYFFPEKEEVAEKYATLLNMLHLSSIEEIENIEKKQKQFQKKIPFKVKYEDAYLWEIYYDEITNQYFMLVPGDNPGYNELFYLLKMQIAFAQNKKNEPMIYVPINLLNYSDTILTKTEIKDLGNYLWLFTGDWANFYEVYNSKEELSLHIIGETKIYERIKTHYKIVLKDREEGSKFYKKIKALFILQTELSNFYHFQTKINAKSELEFYHHDKKMEYDQLAEFIKNETVNITEQIQNNYQKIENLKEELKKLKETETEKEKQYLLKQKEISTYLQCKKTFLGKVKYFFKSKKTKKTEEVILLEEQPQKEYTNINLQLLENVENEKNRYSIENLVAIYYLLKQQTNMITNMTLDYNALKIKNENMELKLKNAQTYIDEINNHKKSIFEFWKFANKDEKMALEVGNEVEEKREKITKTFQFETDIEELGNKMDKLQRVKLSNEELNSIFLTTDKEILKEINVKRDIEKLLQNLKQEREQKEEEYDIEVYDIFGMGLVDRTKTKKLADKKHREIERDKFRILNLSRNTSEEELKSALERFSQYLKESFNKIKAPSDIPIYFITSEEMKFNQYLVGDLDEENVLKSLTEKKGKLYKVTIKESLPILFFTNIVYYDNRNNTLPVGMNVSTKAMIDGTKLEFVLKEKGKFKTNAYSENTDITDKLEVKEIEYYEYEAKEN